MPKFNLTQWFLLCFAPVFSGYLLAGIGGDPRLSVQQDIAESREPTPPKSQSYIGTKNCAVCHFEKYKTWKLEKHAKAFDILPDKYREDKSCLKCHTTGYNEESGYKTIADTHLAGTSCEACHGPGSKHREICQTLASAKKLSTEQEALARDSIWLLKPGNICIDCHATKGHQAHPKYDKQ